MYHPTYKQVIYVYDYNETNMRIVLYYSYFVWWMAKLFCIIKTFEN